MPERDRTRRSLLNRIITASLRKSSGAAVTPGEEEAAEKTYAEFTNEELKELLRKNPGSLEAKILAARKGEIAKKSGRGGFKHGGRVTRSIDGRATKGLTRASRRR